MTTPIERAFAVGLAAGRDRSAPPAVLVLATYLEEQPPVPSVEDLATFREFCSSYHARAHHPKTCEALDRLLAAWT